MPEYIPEKSSPNIQQAFTGLEELAQVFAEVAQKKQGSWFEKQRRAAGVYQAMAEQARSIGDRLDKQDVSKSVHELTNLHTTFMFTAVETGTPKTQVPPGEKMNDVSNLLMNEFFRLSDEARAAAPAPQPLKL